MAVSSSRIVWEQRVQQTAARAEEDLRRVIKYMNDEIVPDLRRRGATTMRAGAAELEQWAIWLDGRKTPLSPLGAKEDARG